MNPLELPSLTPTPDKYKAFKEENTSLLQEERGTVLIKMPATLSR